MKELYIKRGNKGWNKFEAKNLSCFILSRLFFYSFPIAVCLGNIAFSFKSLN